MTGSNDAAMSLIGEITNQMARLVRAAEQVRTVASNHPREVVAGTLTGQAPWSTDRLNGHQHRQLAEDVATANDRARVADLKFKDLLDSATAITSVDPYDRNRVEIADLKIDWDRLRELRDNLTAEVDALSDLYTRITDAVGARPGR